MYTAAKRLEFRIPISPTPSFFSQVRLFNYALRRLGPAYESARLLLVVGDHGDMESVLRQNSWSEDFNIVWERVPDAIADQFGIWGTANWRLKLPSGDADVIILSDADTVMLRDIDTLLSELPSSQPAMCGHMAHFPPPVSGEGVPAAHSFSFWPWLFNEFGMSPASKTYPYSMDEASSLPRAPAYFNLGFVVMNSATLPIMDTAIFEVERRINALTKSHMRCQIAITIIAHQMGIDIGVLPASYNAANDLGHFEANGLTVDEIRVLHYLRTDEIDRSSMLLPNKIDTFLKQRLSNPINIALQNLVRSYRESLSDSHKNIWVNVDDGVEC